MTFAVIDFIFLIVLALFIFFGLKDGFIRGIVGIVSFFGALIVAGLIAEPVSGFIYDTFFEASVNDAIAAGATSLKQIVDESAGFISGFVNWNSISSSSAPRTIIVSFLSTIIFVVLVVILLIAFSLTARLLTQAVKFIPFGNSINKLLGAVTGIIKALLIAFIFAFMLKSAYNVTDSFLGITREQAENSLVFGVIYDLAPEIGKV